MVKRVFAITTFGGFALLAFVGLGAQRGSAQMIASDATAGLIIYPKIVSDPFDMFQTGIATDTIIQLTNTAQEHSCAGGETCNDPANSRDTGTRVLQCIYVDATSHCSNGANSFDPIAGTCRTSSDCTQGGSCVPGWSKIDFPLVLSQGQPTGWSVSTAGPLGGLGGNNVNPVAPTPPSYFIGELKCFEVDGTSTVSTSDLPINRNDLKGEATIYGTRVAGTLGTGDPGMVDARSYNAIGIPAVSSNGATQSDQVLCLGATAGSTECTQAEYAQCPNTLILNHLFDSVVIGEATDTQTSTDLTLVPCTENFADAAAQPTTAVQFLVFNEFEQRFSASTRVSCFKETPLSQIDARPGQEFTSIFNAATAGTLSGQTRIRPVPGSETESGHGLLAVAEEFKAAFGPGVPFALVGSAAYNLNYAGVNQGKGDFLRFTTP